MEAYHVLKTPFFPCCKYRTSSLEGAEGAEGAERAEGDEGAKRAEGTKVAEGAEGTEGAEGLAAVFVHTIDKWLEPQSS